jgi:hypothetical protein
VGDPERFVSLEEDALSASWVARGGRPAVAVIPACRHAYLHGS